MTNEKTSLAAADSPNFWEAEAQRLIDAVGEDFLLKASIEEILEKAKPTFSHADENQVRSAIAVAMRRLNAG